MIGDRLARREDRRLLTGTGHFVDDLHIEGTLHARIVRGTQAHAELAGIDTAEALASPGVVELITAADIGPEIKIPAPMAIGDSESYLQPPLARERVRYVGEPIAMVIAESAYAAEDAASRVTVEYTPLAPCLDAADPGPDRLFAEAESNVTAVLRATVGDIDQAFAAADHVVSKRLLTNRHGAVPLEPRGLAARIDPLDGRVILEGAAKMVHSNRDILATMLGLPRESVRLIEVDVGGGFGARGELHPEDFLVAFATLRLGRPVKWIADRSEDLCSTNHSREQVHDIALALDADGKLLGLKDEVAVDAGAYVRPHGGVVAEMTMAHLPGPYRWRAYSCSARQVVTNKVPMGTYRAPGRFEATFARETMLDIAAEAVGLDRLELRRRNLIPASAMPYDTGVTNAGEAVIYESGDYPRMLDDALERLDYDRLCAWRAEPTEPRRYRGLGLALYVEEGGEGPWEYARASLDSRGKIDIACGVSVVGQGLETSLIQIAATALGVPESAIGRFRRGDTDEVPYGIGSFGSRSISLAGSAVAAACAELREKLVKCAADLLEAAEDDLTFDGETIVVRGSPKRSVSLAELFEARRPGVALAQERTPRLSSEHFHRSRGPNYPYGVEIAAVEIDGETGGVSIHAFGVANELGRIINPLIAEGQIVGGAAQGVSGALLEQFAYDEAGQPTAASFMDYLLPTAADLPRFDVLLTEYAPSPQNPLGAKGAGEGGIAAGGAVLANAVRDALGVDVDRLPLTPERLASAARDGR